MDLQLAAILQIICQIDCPVLQMVCKIIRDELCVAGAGKIQNHDRPSFFSLGFAESGTEYFS